MKKYKIILSSFIVIYFTCSEMKVNDKNWLMDQMIFNDFINLKDSIINIKFDMDTNEVNFEIIMSEEEANKRDLMMTENWKIEKENGIVVYFHKSMKNVIFIRSYKNRIQKFYYLGDNALDMENISKSISK